MAADCIPNKFPIKLPPKEAEEERKDIIDFCMKKLKRSKERAEKSADIWEKVVNETAKEFGEE